MWQQLAGKTIRMEGSILGFPEQDAFTIQPVEDSDGQAPFAYLQSEEKEDIGFLVIDPFTFFPSYEIQLSDGDKSAIEVTEPNDVALLGIVSIARPFENSTVNLLAPLLLNVQKLKGRQIVLPPESPYQTKTPLFSSAFGKGGNPSADSNA
jgi:flagellar assembly factor FliW